MPMSSAFPRQCRLLAAGSGAASIWGEEVFLPPASGSSSQWSIGVFSAVPIMWFAESVSFAWTCLRIPPSHNPPSRFHIGCMWCRFRFGFLNCKITAALIRRPGRPSENARGANANALAPNPPMRAQDSPAKDRRDRGQVSRQYENEKMLVGRHIGRRS